MFFVLGLFLIAVGIGLSTVTQTVTTYTNYFGYQIPSGQQTVYPYVSIGLVMVIVGIIVLVGAFIKTRSKKTVTVKMEMPKTEQA
jgi:uncharacterized membrane protein HdeD (DUF308 family)